MNYHLRAATPDDHSWLEDLRRQAYLELFIATWGSRDEDRHQRHFANFLKQGNIIIVQLEQTDVGMLQIMESSDRIEISEIQLLPQYQGQGLGSKLLQDIVAKSHGQKKDVYLSLGLFNIKAYRLYSRIGFQEYRRSETHFYMKNRASKKNGVRT